MVLSGVTYLNGQDSGTHVFQDFTFSSEFAATYRVSHLEGSNYTFDHWSYDAGGADDKIEVQILGQAIYITAKSGYKLMSGPSEGEVVMATFTGKLYVNGGSGPVTNLRVTLVADPSEFGTVSGGGVFNYGDTCTVVATAKSVSGKKIKFERWSDDGAQTHSFVVTQSVTLTAYFVEYGDLYLGCYGRSMTWWRASPWRATMSYGGRSVTWDANTSDINGHMLSSALQVPIGESVSVTTSLTSAQVPAQMEYTFHGFFGWNPDDGTKPLLSANQTFQFTMTKATDWILPLFDAKIKCSVIPFRSLEYKDGTWQDHQRERLSGLSEIREPIVTLGTGETVTLVAKSNYWDFDITWDQVALEQIQSVAEGFESFFEMKVLIRPTKTAENDVTVGALQVVSSAFSIKTDGSSDRKFSVGVHDYSEYKDTGVPFSDAATFYSCKQVKSGVSTTRAEINCDFALGPLIRWVVTASESLDVDRATITNDGWNFTNFYGSFTSENKTSGNYTSIELAMIPAFKSGGRYSFRFPASATVLNGAVLRYFEGDDNSLSIRLVKNGTAQLPVKRGSGESVAYRLTGYGSEYSFTSLGATDVLDVLMHVGTFWPLRNASGTILKGSSGSILNDS